MPKHPEMQQYCHLHDELRMTLIGYLKGAFSLPIQTTLRPSREKVLKICQNIQKCNNIISFTRDSGGSSTGLIDLSPRSTYVFDRTL
jgi:hypothetical protein